MLTMSTKSLNYKQIKFTVTLMSVCVIAVTLIIVFYSDGLIYKNNYWSNYCPEYGSKQYEYNNSHQILVWTPIFYEYYNYENLASFCKYSNCMVTSNRAKLSTSDAVLFHWRNIFKNDIPAYHLPHQNWIVFNLEPPDFTQPGRVYPIMSDINWTMSYRRDSDIYSPYGKVVECNNSWKFENKFERKTKEIAWASGHCLTESNREGYINELSRYMPVSKYGECGNLRCDPAFSEHCYNHFADTYKFFLSFENALCKDYVTEKLYNILRYDIIPVVYGAANYSQLLPQNSYIDAMNFSSPKRLADFLKDIASDKNKYNSYFTWKSKYCVEVAGFISKWGKVNRPTFLCDICEKLNTVTVTGNKLHENIVEWWLKDADCDYKSVEMV